VAGAKRKRSFLDKLPWRPSGHDMWSLEVAMGLLREVIAADDEFGECGGAAAAAGVVVVSGWEGREEELEAARKIADAGKKLMKALMESNRLADESGALDVEVQQVLRLFDSEYKTQESPDS
jgi:hypothetical protein